MDAFKYATRKRNPSPLKQAVFGVINTIILYVSIIVCLASLWLALVVIQGGVR